MVILYTLHGNGYIDLKDLDTYKGITCYVNSTNRCSCACTFCLRNTKEMLESNSLWLKREPTVEMIIVSISLNAPTKEEYYELTRACYGVDSFNYMLQFTKACKKYVPSVVLTVVDIIGVEKIKLCQKIADGLGVELRVRPFEE